MTGRVIYPSGMAEVPRITPWNGELLGEELITEPEQPGGGQQVGAVPLF